MNSAKVQVPNNIFKLLEMSFAFDRLSLFHGLLLVQNHFVRMTPGDNGGGRSLKESLARGVPPRSSNTEPVHDNSCSFRYPV